jgi:hypothetical protein
MECSEVPQEVGAGREPVCAFAHFVISDKNLRKSAGKQVSTRLQPFPSHPKREFRRDP